MNFIKQNSEVFYAQGPIVEVCHDDISKLKELATRVPRRRSRLCAHKSTNDNIHEMLIVHEKDIYVRPHKHLVKGESFHIIDGEVDVVLFDDSGKVTHVITLGAYHLNMSFYYRLDDPVYHTVLIRSDVAVFHETTAGPFRREDTVFAEWSPEEEKEKEVENFQNNLNAEITSCRKDL
jgi:cupin fold WbuC family metalloprotein